MPEPLCLIGGGEHARVVAEAATLAGLAVVGWWGPEAASTLPRLGDDRRLAAELERWQGHGFHLALSGQPRDGVRRRLADQHRALRWTTVVHPTAFVSPSAQLGAGVFVGPRAVIHAGARLGDHALINSAVVVEHDVEVGAGARLAPGAVCGGGARIGAWAFCGLGCAIRDHVTVGDGAMVGMGAVVVGDVAPGTTVVGNPARAGRA
jgi:acetyltransferase EpsM